MEESLRDQYQSLDRRIEDIDLRVFVFPTKGEKAYRISLPRAIFGPPKECMALSTKLSSYGHGQIGLCYQAILLKRSHYKLDSYGESLLYEGIEVLYHNLIRILQFTNSVTMSIRGTLIQLQLVLAVVTEIELIFGNIGTLRQSLQAAIKAIEQEFL